MEAINHTLSDAIGLVSLACWVVVMFPQIHLNYTKKSGEGVSLLMMAAWVCGDVFNIAGVLMQDMVMSTVVIASYYLLVDCTLLYQTIYYRVVYRAHLPKSPEPTEEEALVARDTRPSTHDAEQPPLLAVVLSLATVASLFAMLFALLLSPPGAEPSKPAPRPSQIIAQAMGTLSAIVYIMSYVPQAIQNYRRRSCEGLSVWLFLLSLMGNTTYSLAILVVSLDPAYLAPYVPWLLGALIPCLIQIGILYQFYKYPH
ncbi:PQ loop repeat-domain-containing protein [Coemansia spiralis]|nr:PQ loop repeat-domain-containing protein [Coemansia spiralis]